MKFERLHRPDFTHHPRPHHVHIDPSCNNHASPDCLDDHWEGGRPEREHPHHVEVDCSTGLVGYTRLSAEEIAEHERVGAANVARRQAEEARREADLQVLRSEADNNPVIAAILRHLGVQVAES